MFAGSWGAADDRVIADPANLGAMKSMVHEAARQGPAGRVVDEVTELLPRGFSVTQIKQPVHIWCGALDSIDTRMTADYLAGAIPRATLVTYPDAAHLFAFDYWAEMLVALS